jgi:hypothetical protein
MRITKIRNADKGKIIDELNKDFKNKGYQAYVSSTNGAVSISGIRLSDEYVKKYGYNRSPYTGRRGKVLGWQNWVEVNNTINNVLDRLGASANASSLHGRFKIREGNKRFTEMDWENLAYENVGSVYQPVYRKDAWLPEDTVMADKRLHEVL